MRSIVSFGVWMGVLLVGVPAYAAVENVKISGDVTARGIYKESYTLGGVKDNDTFNGTIFNPADDTQRFVMSQVRVRVNADLTQKVSAEVEFLNQRDWDPPAGGVQGSTMGSAANIGPGGAGTPPGTDSAGNLLNDQFQVLLNLANITIRDLYYEGLSVKIGRQNIQWGEGFVLGNKQLGNPDPSNSIAADEFSQFTSFDAIRIMLDRAPWHFDAVWMKIQENGVNLGDDQDAFGINIGRTFNAYDAEAEIYFLGSRDAGRTNSVGDTFTTTEEIWNLGTRGSIRPWERLKLSGEVVFQWGEEGGTSTSVLSPFTLNGQKQQDIRAWAFDLRTEWDWLESPWPATLGAEWVFYSGEEDSEDGKSGAYRPNFRGKFHSAIREFQGQFYLTDVPVTAGFTNEHQLMFDASFHPFNNKDLTFFGRWLLYWLDEIPVAGRGRFLGNELDAVLSYAYTEDLTFRLIGALFVPGDYFKTDALTITEAGQSVTTADETAKLLSGEVTLAF